MNKKKKTILLSVLGVLFVIAIIVGTTYAFWKVTKVQEGEANTLTTTCLDVDLTSMSSGINLDTQFPITDEEGRQLSGYTFKISNKCNTYVSYDINLESLNNVTEAKRLNLNDLVAIIDDGNVLGLGYYPTTSSALKTEDGTAYDTRKLITDTLSPGSITTPTSKEYTLRIWLDEDASIEVANKEWNGKISITASPVIAENAVAKLTELAKTNTEEMFTDDTEDANIRYMGKDPANYVTFANEYYSEDIYYSYNSEEDDFYPYRHISLETCQKGVNETYNFNCTKIHSKGDPILWRVIGSMNNVEDGTGVKETRIKLIRDEIIGDIAWDTKCIGIYDEATESCSKETHNNNWETATLNKTLNEAFYNSTKTTEPNLATSYMPVSKILTWHYLDYSNSGLKKVHRNLINSAVYYLGGTDVGPSSEYYANKMTSKIYYTVERSSHVQKNNSITWTEKVGIMYPSDYGFASSGGNNISKEECNNIILFDESYFDASELLDECNRNNWMYHKDDEWTITHTSASAQNDLVTHVSQNGYVTSLYNFSAFDAIAIRPVVYLKSDVKIMSGDGTKTNPFVLGA